MNLDACVSLTVPCVEQDGRVVRDPLNRTIEHAVGDPDVAADEEQAGNADGPAAAQRARRRQSVVRQDEPAVGEAHLEFELGNVALLKGRDAEVAVKHRGEPQGFRRPFRPRLDVLRHGLRGLKLDRLHLGLPVARPRAEFGDGLRRIGLVTLHGGPVFAEQILLLLRRQIGFRGDTRA